jgi:transcriptional regulator with XRE-family HTH domain
MWGFEIDGAKFRAFRQARGWSQLELAATAGVSERTIRNAERGRSLRRDFLEYLAGALGVDPAELLRDPEVLLPALRWQRQADRILVALQQVQSELTAKPLTDCCLPDVETSHYSSFPLEFAGDFHRADEVRRYFDLALPWVASRVDRQYTFDGVRGSGNLVLFSGTDSFRSLDNGHRLHVRWTHIFELERERIRRAEAWTVHCTTPVATWQGQLP